MKKITNSLNKVNTLFKVPIKEIICTKLMLVNVMKLPKSQDRITHRLKTRGPQSVKILSKQLDMTTMGARQHLTDLESKGLVEQTQEERQTRGRPVHMWKLSKDGHARFPDSHSQTTIELIDVIRSSLGEESLNQLIDERSEKIEATYRAQLDATAP